MLQALVVACCLLAPATGQADGPSERAATTHTCSGTTDSSVSADADTGAMRARVASGSNDPLRWGLTSTSACVDAVVTQRWDDVLPGRTYRVVARFASLAPPSADVSPDVIELLPGRPKASSRLTFAAFGYACQPGWQFCGGGGPGQVRIICSTNGGCADPGAFDLNTDVTMPEDVTHMRIIVRLMADASTSGRGRATVDVQIALQSVSVTLLP